MWILVLFTIGCSPPELAAVSPVAIPAGREADTFTFEATINDPADMPDDTFHECDVSNNTSTAVDFFCPSVM